MSREFDCPIVIVPLGDDGQEGSEAWTYDLIHSEPPGLDGAVLDGCDSPWGGRWWKVRATGDVTPCGCPIYQFVGPDEDHDVFEGYCPDETDTP